MARFVSKGYTFLHAPVRCVYEVTRMGRLASLTSTKGLLSLHT